ncbi:expressed unknown protein [Seminavis robusta]|uniref:Uncharacterized protein n=1 Tax=Seminavis robusta TaxID=568900 RepID=A0A9N8DUP7_9STRA|nr:expressed unknown protein [Seminavis robusta]|eukprot:Sro356_g125320.1 n/a (358) ;mRNA; r:27589-28662
MLTKPRLPTWGNITVLPISKELADTSERSDLMSLDHINDGADAKNKYLEPMVSFPPVCDSSSILDTSEVQELQEETWDSSFDYGDDVTMKLGLAVEANVNKTSPCPVSAQQQPHLDIVDQPESVLVPHAVSPSPTSCHPIDSSMEHPNHVQRSTSAEPAPIPSNMQLGDAYSSPLHVALRHGTSLPVVKAIVHASTSLLTQKDGPEGLIPLTMSLKTRPRDSETHYFLLQALPRAAAIASDTRHDLPLHVACCGPVDIGVISALIQANPMAVCHANAHGLTPLDIVAEQPDSLCNRELLKLLQQAAPANHDQVNESSGAFSAWSTQYESFQQWSARSLDPLSFWLSAQPSPPSFDSI